jgi:hypothetical protein
MGYAVPFPSFDGPYFNGMDSTKAEGVGMRHSRQCVVDSWQSVVGSQSPMLDAFCFFIDKASCRTTTNNYRLATGNCQLSSTNYKLIILSLLLALCLGASAAKGADHDGRWAILISGASGDPGLQKMYLKEMADLHSILAGPFEFPRDQIFVLFDDPSLKPDLIGYKSTMENLQTVCRNLAGRVRKEDLVFVFIEGHGNYDGKVYRLNLVGPDPTAEDLASALTSIPAQRIAVVNATNCSGGSLPALSQKGRIVITATKSGMEKNQTHLGQYFIDALKNSAADSDKNGRVSFLEAFSYASQKVDEYYIGEGSLQTEHPVLDDNGDGQAQNKPSQENGEGLLAGTTFLDARMHAEKQNLNREQQELARAAQELEKQIEALKYAKSQMPEAEYEKKLEELLLRLARINAKLPQ